jgi:hypothetical protein
MKKWEESGYKIPKIVYWNVAGYSGSPATVHDNRVALVSGFSPSILKAILACKDMSPVGVMQLALEKYKVTI